MKKPFVTLEQAKKIIETYPTPFHIYDEKGYPRKCEEGEMPHFPGIKGSENILR